MSDPLGILEQAAAGAERYRGAVFVVHLGEAVFADAGRLQGIVRDVVVLHRLGVYLTLVCEGGAAGEARGRGAALLSALAEHGLRGVRLAGADAGCMALGADGSLAHFDPTLAHHLMPVGFLPVLLPLATAGGAEERQVPGLHVAYAAAAKMSAEKLIALSGVAGLPGEHGGICARTTPEELARRREGGGLPEALVPLVEAVGMAVQAGVRAGHVLEAGRPRALLEAVLTAEGCGTLIVSEEARRRRAAEERAAAGGAA